MGSVMGFKKPKCNSLIQSWSQWVVLCLFNDRWEVVVFWRFYGFQENLRFALRAAKCALTLIQSKGECILCFITESQWDIVLSIILESVLVQMFILNYLQITACLQKSFLDFTWRLEFVLGCNCVESWESDCVSHLVDYCGSLDLLDVLAQDQVET